MLTAFLDLTAQEQQSVRVHVCSLDILDLTAQEQQSVRVHVCSLDILDLTAQERQFDRAHVCSQLFLEQQFVRAYVCSLDILGLTAQEQQFDRAHVCSQVHWGPAAGMLQIGAPLQPWYLLSNLLTLIKKSERNGCAGSDHAPIALIRFY